MKSVRDTGHDVDAVAARWHGRARSGQMTAAEEGELHRWLDADPQHRAAYDSIDMAWNALGSVRDHPRMVAMREALPARSGRRWAAMAMAACLAAAVIGAGAGGAWMMWRPHDELADQSFQTGVGQKAVIKLPDGSEVTLNTGTVLRTRGDAERRLVYLDRGQAYFRVARDKRHPFVVHAAGRTITALGTAFDVRVDEGRFSVTLVEGKVRVERPAAQPRPASPAMIGSVAPPIEATEMAPGSELTAVSDQQWTVKRTDIVKATGWIRDQLIFEREPLESVVAEMNRYSVRQIVIADPAVGRTLVSGNFRPGDVEGFARAVEAYRYAVITADTPAQIELSAVTAR